jgi:hypothetical protein
MSKLKRFKHVNFYASLHEINGYWQIDIIPSLVIEYVLNTEKINTFSSYINVHFSFAVFTIGFNIFI